MVTANAGAVAVPQSHSALNGETLLSPCLKLNSKTMLFDLVSKVT